MDVLFLPDYTDLNPYQDELASWLRQRGHSVSFSDRYVVPILRGYRESSPDVIHVHWLHTFTLADSFLLTAVKTVQLFLELLVVQLLTESAIVWTVHNRREHEKRWPLLEKYVRTVFVIGFCDRVIVHCPAAEEIIMDELYLPERARNRISVVPHGNYIDVYQNEISATEAKNRLGVSNDERVLLFIGSIRPYKQVPKLIDSFGRVDASQMRLLVAGKPWNRQLARRLEEQCAGYDNVDLTLEMIPEEEFQVYLNAADAVVLPFEESVLTSGSVLLAMSFGKALVVPRVGCLPETVPQQGRIMYDPDHDGALQMAIETAPEVDLEALGEANLAAARDLHWGYVAGETMAVYDAVRGG